MPTYAEDRGSIEVTDDELVERAVGGEVSAFDELARRHGPAVYRAARAVLASNEDAEDVMQDALILAYRKLSHFRGHSSFKTWVLRITWRCALRRRANVARRLFQVVSSSEIFSEAFGREKSAESLMLAGELNEELWRLIRTLPRRLRDPLLLAASGKYSYEELSDILDVPTGTLKWRISEARRILREKLQRLGYAPSS